MHAGVMPHLAPVGGNNVRPSDIRNSLGRACLRPDMARQIANLMGGARGQISLNRVSGTGGEAVKVAPMACKPVLTASDLTAISCRRIAHGAGSRLARF